ncbi:hypothetical protein HZB02_02235 [Candidatus Woesearchaeota archaeon]|nr:hypothetical protein [Candidatus Woesearchaeota archaeon]
MRKHFQQTFSTIKKYPLLFAGIALADVLTVALILAVIGMIQIPLVDEVTSATVLLQEPVQQITEAQNNADASLEQILNQKGDIERHVEVIKQLLLILLLSILVIYALFQLLSVFLTYKIYGKTMHKKEMVQYGMITLVLYLVLLLLLLGLAKLFEFNSFFPAEFVDPLWIGIPFLLVTGILLLFAQLLWLHLPLKKGGWIAALKLLPGALFWVVVGSGVLLLPALLFKQIGVTIVMGVLWICLMSVWRVLGIVNQQGQ